METSRVVNHVLHCTCRFKLFVQSCCRSLHKVDVVLKSVVVVCTKFCTKKEESWQVNFDIKNRFIPAANLDWQTFTIVFAI